MSTSTIFTGRVKWFNEQKGYGFITPNKSGIINTSTESTTSGEDIFVHYTGIILSEKLEKTEKKPYGYLVEGEYVEFVLISANNSDKYAFQASNVRGINGGKLMCETHAELKKPSYTRVSFQETNDKMLPPRKPYNNTRPQRYFSPTRPPRNFSINQFNKPNPIVPKVNKYSKNHSSIPKQSNTAEWVDIITNKNSALCSSTGSCSSVKDTLQDV